MEIREGIIPITIDGEHVVAGKYRHSYPDLPSWRVLVREVLGSFDYQRRPGENQRNTYTEWEEVVTTTLTEGSVQVGETGRYVNIPHYTCDECGSVVAIPAGVRVYKEEV